MRCHPRGRIVTRTPIDFIQWQKRQKDPHGKGEIAQPFIIFSEDIADPRDAIALTFLVWETVGEADKGVSCRGEGPDLKRSLKDHSPLQVLRVTTLVETCALCGISMVPTFSLPDGNGFLARVSMSRVSSIDFI